MFEMQHPKPHKVAIVGMGLRFPGANTPESYWKIFADGREVVRETPEWRKCYDPGNFQEKRGGYLDGEHSMFDNAFFRTSKREAMSQDPQQHVLLETAFEALEDAGTLITRIGITAPDHPFNTLCT